MCYYYGYYLFRLGVIVFVLINIVLVDGKLYVGVFEDGFDKLL